MIHFLYSILPFVQHTVASRNLYRSRRYIWRRPVGRSLHIKGNHACGHSSIPSSLVSGPFRSVDAKMTGGVSWSRISAALCCKLLCRFRSPTFRALLVPRLLRPQFGFSGIFPFSDFGENLKGNLVEGNFS
ncbi:hypothetical protein CDAR_612561 [Caerostris darwini]|uniref:Uncharacterized protein n=1 Tax=Caerostris darwini TaxID=1538125 RepID=A0AAV4SJT4_9ARAC|nr:hypothetical protein CDAR_612561 [Caerostris darwini]